MCNLTGFLFTHRKQAGVQLICYQLVIILSLVPRPSILIFLNVTLKNIERPGYEASYMREIYNTASCTCVDSPLQLAPSVLDSTIILLW